LGCIVALGWAVEDPERIKRRIMAVFPASKGPIRLQSRFDVPFLILLLSVFPLLSTSL
jgi:hypothetical protein